MNEQRNRHKAGTVLNNRYKIENEIGSGGFAITYKAIDIQINVPVAVKQLFPLDSSLLWEHEKERFIKEARILREFDYLEGIVSVRDVFEDTDTVYLVMDYIDGISLKEYVSEYGVISWDELVSMLTPVMKSLAKIHRRNIVHYDISPGNLMIGMDNKVWLIDFGASDKCMQGGERTVIIKNGYAPIEQYYSDESLADGKTGPWTDVYGMAATMYTALTGEKPKSAVERLKAIRNNIRPFNSKVSDSSCPDNDIALEKKSLLNNNLEEWKANVILKGMAVDKSDRYASMEEFIEAVSFPPKKDEYTRVISGIDEYEYVKAGNNKKSPKYFIIIIIAIAALLFGIVLSSIVGNKNMQIANDNTDHSEDTNIVTESKTEDDTVFTENSEEKESIGNNVEHKAEDQSEITTDDKVEDSKVEDGKVQEDTGKKIEINTEDDTDKTSSELDDDELY